jgi:hypothetical protein
VVGTRDNVWRSLRLVGSGGGYSSPVADGGGRPRCRSSRGMLGRHLCSSMVAMGRHLHLSMVAMGSRPRSLMVVLDAWRRWSKVVEVGWENQEDV